MNPQVARRRHRVVRRDVDTVPPPGRPGERNPAARLTRQQVAVVRALRQNGMTLRAIAEAMSMSQSQIGNIVRGKCWT